jgi:hypothetical protein
MHEIGQHFQLPENIVPFALISLGKQEGEIPEKHIKE